MKKILLAISALLLITVITGCDDTKTSVGNNIEDNVYKDTFTLQGSIFDATTGARLQGSSLKLYMVRGTANVVPNVLRKGTNETTFAGDYAFLNVPLSVDSADNITYRVVAVMDGYQQFETYVSYTDNLDGSINSGDSIYPYRDGVHNMVGNIYMYPTGATASDVEVYVEYDDERVAGATVQLQQIVASNAVTVPTTTLLPAVNGLLPSLTAETAETTGLATFAGTSLVLGGAYKVVVLPIKYDGIQLAKDEPATVTIGDDTVSNVVHVEMEDVSPGTGDNGLYIVYASNQDEEDVLASGVLTINFNRAVALVSEEAFVAAITTDDVTVGAATLEDADPEDTCTAALSNGGTTLTLTPNFDEALGDDDTNAFITFTGGTVTIGDNTDVAVDLWAIKYLDGTSVLDADVNVQGPQTD